MPTSGSNDFKLNRAQWLARSLRMVGAVDKGQTVDKKLEVDAAIAANCLLKELDLQFSNLHLMQASTITLQAGVAAYTTLNGLPNNVNEIASAVYLDSSTAEHSLDVVSYVDYEKLVDKTVIGIPKKIFLTEEVDLSTRTAYLWPIPQDSRPFRLRYWRRVFDVDAQVDDLDFPPESYNYLTFRLAADLAEEFAVADSKAQRLLDRSRLLFQDLKARMTPKTSNYPLKERKYF